MSSHDLDQRAWSVQLDVASILYKVHRCTHGHGDELPNGFDFVPTENDTISFTVDIESGTVALSTTTILGLVAVAVLSPVNVEQQIPMAYHIWQPLIADDGRRDTIWLPIHQWWGRRDDFVSILEKFPRSQTKLEFRPEHFD